MMAELELDREDIQVRFGRMASPTILKVLLCAKMIQSFETNG